MAQERPSGVGREKQEHQAPHQRHRPGEPPGEQSVQQGGVGGQDQPGDGVHAEDAGRAVAEVRQLQAEQEAERPPLRFGEVDRQQLRIARRVVRRPCHDQRGERVVVAEEPQLPPAREMRHPCHDGQERDRQGRRDRPPKQGLGHGAGGGCRVADRFGEVGHRAAAPPVPVGQPGQQMVQRQRGIRRPGHRVGRRPQPERPAEQVDRPVKAGQPVQPVQVQQDQVALVQRRVAGPEADGPIVPHHAVAVADQAGRPRAGGVDEHHRVAVEVAAARPAVTLAQHQVVRPTVAAHVVRRRR